MKEKLNEPTTVKEIPAGTDYVKITFDGIEMASANYDAVQLSNLVLQLLQQESVKKLLSISDRNSKDYIQ